MAKLAIELNGRKVEEIEWPGAFESKEDIKRALGERSNVLKALSWKGKVVLLKEDGEPLRMRDFPYNGTIRVTIVTSGAGRS